MMIESKTGKWELRLAGGERRCIETRHFCELRARHNEGKESWFVRSSSWQDCHHCGESPPMEIRVALALMDMG
jgi:hypothetical protein